MLHVTRSGAVFLALTLTGATAAGRPVLHVPADYPTIQAAVDAAKDGDTVLVADGVYSGPGNKNVQTSDKQISIRSEGGAGACAIDCEGDGRALEIGEGVTVEGFTVANGVAANGGAIIMIGGGCTITDCIFLDNAAAETGGALHGVNGGGAVSGCVFSGNAAGLAGGGYYIPHGNDPPPALDDCLFAGNSAPVGGGLYVSSQACAPGPKITGCGFTDNSAVIGGGAYSTDTCFDSTGFLGCTFEGNDAAIGGGLAADGTVHSDLTNCLFAGNTASAGAGLALIGPASRANIVNCTFAANIADDGGAIFGGSYTLTLANCILWGNAPDQILGQASATYSCIQGGWPGEGNIAADPRFADPEAGDYALRGGSSAIDAADKTAVPGGIFTDLAGEPRFVDDPGTPDTGKGNAPLVDMGAYEFQGVTACYPDCDGSDELDLFDFLCFVNLFNAEDAAADCDGDGGLDLFDFLCFVNEFNEGCPG